MENYIRFDWAMKRLLRNKANHAVLEGLIETLLGRKYTIVRFLESEGNQEDINDKFNRVDILAESEKKRTHDNRDSKHKGTFIFPPYAVRRFESHNRIH